MSTTEPMRCELCKKAPVTGESRLTTCETETCVFFDVVVHLATWNALQAALIELQRQAFEAGMGCALGYKLGTDILLLDEEPAWDFTDYLASRSAK